MEKNFTDWIQNNKVLVFIAFWGILILLVVFSLLRNAENDTQTCRCLEVVGDESNFVCYTPAGELDTKGECVGPKIY